MTFSGDESHNMSTVSIMITNAANRVGVNPKELKRFIKFATVGIIGAIVDFGTFNVLRLFGMDTLPAGMISFVLAVCSNFVWNRYWTYPDSRSKRIRWQLLQFFAVNATGLLIRAPILRFGEPPVARAVQGTGWFSAELNDFLGANITLAIAVGIVMFWNFFVNRYWTYGDVD